MTMTPAQAERTAVTLLAAYLETVDPQSAEDVANACEMLLSVAGVAAVQAVGLPDTLRRFDDTQAFLLNNAMHTAGMPVQ